jgi:hypothetical protein
MANQTMSRHLPLLACVFAAGCFGTSANYMTAMRPPQAIAAPPDQAMVVFVRPSKMAYAVSANILDETGRFLGDIPAEGHFAVPIAAGRHTFVIWAENTDALTAELLPGKIYFVEVYASMGAWSAHMHLRAIKPSLGSWAQRDGWMLSTTQYTPDLAAGQANLAGKVEAVQERLRRGNEHLAKYQGADLDLHTLAPTDGI